MKRLPTCILCLLFACSGSGAEDAGAGDATLVDAGSSSDGEVDVFDAGPDVFDAGPDVFDAGPFVAFRAITAEEYDCRAVATPERRAAPPADCFLDPACDDPLVVGHRGAGGAFGLYTPENSLSSIRLAILLGIDAVEIDLRHTADDELVLMHDTTLERTTSSDAVVSDLTLEELRAIPLNVEGYSGEFACERVPEFREVLRMARGRITLILDTKTNRGDLVAEALLAEGMLDEAFVSVSSPDTAVAAREAVSEVRIQLRPDDVAEWELMRDRFTRPPEIFEVIKAQVENFLPIAAASDSKVFLDVFGADAVVLVTGDFSQYESAYATGTHVVQSEFPFWVLETLGRRDWSTLPPHRPIGLESPLLP
ncbi:MAG: glycerophosphoryl diester phosphodiesterase [Polyangiales bacterium]|jgi:glycerophosphoryl diester phosphodiesterase